MGGQLLEGWLDESAGLLVSVARDGVGCKQTFKKFVRNFY